MRRIVIAGALLSHVDQDFLIHVAHVRDDLRSDLERCAGIVGFDLDDGSPLINAGNDAQGGIQLLLDLAGKPRYFAGHVDIGAFEYNDTIFDNGFETL